MIKHPVQYNSDISPVSLSHQLPQRIVISQPPIYPVIISRVVAMRAGFKHRTQVQRIAAQRDHMVQPGNQFQQARLGRRLVIILLRRAAQSQWVNMIENSRVNPVSHSVSP